MKPAWERSAGRWCAALLLALGLCPGVASAQNPAPAPDAAAVRTGRVNVELLNIRARPGERYEVIGKLRRGDEVRIVGERNEWFEVVLPESVVLEAWVAAAFLDAEGRVTADRLRVHSGPGIVFSDYEFLPRGTLVKKLGAPNADGWQKIATPANVSAWVSGKYLTVTGAGAAVPGAPAGGEPGPSAPVDPPAAPAAPQPVAGAGEPAQTEGATAAVADVPGGMPADTPPGTSGETPVKPVPAAGGMTGTAEPVPDAVVRPEAGAAPKAVTRVGSLTALGAQASPVATHLLSVQVGQMLYPACYLSGQGVKLAPWEGKEVRVSGREVWYPGWKRPVIEVVTIEALKPK